MDGLLVIPTKQKLMKQYFYSRNDQGSIDDLNSDFLGNGTTVWFLENEKQEWYCEDKSVTIDPLKAKQFTAKMQAMTFSIVNGLAPQFKPTEHEFPKSTEVNNNGAFLRECVEWLSPFGYSFHCRDASYNSCGFIHNTNHYAPTILCTNTNGEKKVCLSSRGYKLFLKMTTGDIQFKHPDIKKYIDTMAHYERICMENPPW